MAGVPTSNSDVCSFAASLHWTFGFLALSMTIPLCLHDDDASFKTDQHLELNIYCASLQKQQFTNRDATPLKTHSFFYRSFTDNRPAQLWYFVKCIYFALSAYQIRSSYPTRILGNFLTKKYNYLNLFMYKG
jgi:hypothetical protein